jgi:hypothetical protein
MLEGIRSTPIIAGAYTSDGGICPMLAAHRAGGRTNASSFARVWDRFAFRGARVTGPRPATARELLILSTQLEASLIAEDAPGADLAAAIVSHQELMARRAESGKRQAARELASAREQASTSAHASAGPDHAAAEQAQPRERPGDPDRSRELGSRPGWSWMRVVRTYNEYERVLERLECERTALEERAEPAPSAHIAPERELV